MILAVKKIVARQLVTTLTQTKTIKMKKLLILICSLAMTLGFIACNKYETFAQKREKEDAAISKFLAGGTEMSKMFCNGKPVSVISETDFEKRGYVTDTTKNEFVLFESTGVYMQIVRKGCGEVIKEGETTTVLCRFTEANLLNDSIKMTNQTLATHYMYDKMTVNNSYGTFTGIFDSTYSLMAAMYQNTSVPGGWLVPFRFINVGRQTSPEDEIAKVNLVVPSSQGQSEASMNTYPCFYQITYQRGI